MNKSHGVPSNDLPPLGTVRALPFRDMIVHARFVTSGDGNTVLRAYYAAEGEEQNGDWVFWGFVNAPAARLGCFSLSEIRRAALSQGASLRHDAGFMKRPMGEVLELEGARGYDEDS